MKKNCFLLLLSAALPLLLPAQPGDIPEKARERIESYKIAFFTERLQLTPEESKDFWPLYNEFEDSRENLRKTYDFEGKRLELLSDQELETHIEQQLKLEEEMVALRRKYIKRFKEVLPIRKVAMLQIVDNDFKRQLLQELRKRQQNRLQPRQRN